MSSWEKIQHRFKLSLQRFPEPYKKPGMRLRSFNKNQQKRTLTTEDRKEVENWGE